MHRGPRTATRLFVDGLMLVLPVIVTISLWTVLNVLPLFEMYYPG